MSDRDEFENWIRKPPFEKSVARHPDSNEVCWPGQYRSLDVQLAWESWKAARAQQDGSGEAVAWACYGKSSLTTHFTVGSDAAEAERKMEALGFYSYEIVPLYTHPQPAQQGSVPDVESVISALRSCSSIAEAEAVIGAQFSLATTPQPEGDGWIQCSERLPTEADGSLVWSHDQKRGTVELCSWGWSHSLYKHGHITDWKPTGLKRPQPPVEQEEG